MKFALVSDWIVSFAGSERVVKHIYSLYPSDVFTLVANDETLQKVGIPSDRVVQSFISRLPFSKEKYRNYLPLFPIAIEQFDLSSYDVIISSSHAVAKGVLTKHYQLHVCYCHTPIRYAWDLYHQYLKEANLEKGLKSLIARVILHYIRLWDYSTANRVDYFISNSRYTARRIKKIYGRDAEVIYPPVDVESFRLREDKEEFYLVASRMVPYKMIPMVVETFSYLPDRKLVVIGDGPEFKKVKNIAKGKSNIEILGYQPNEVLIDYMQRAKAFIFAAEEDFGIMPVEAMACGTPVIAFGRGGTVETVVDGKTGVFFYEQTPSALKDAILKFEKIQDEIDPKFVRSNAEKFSESVFRSRIKEFIDDKINKLF
ncbi:MAG: glycosyltransferase family 4 protein [Spirochaetia bacterium]|nr:glycosyltransferase family 4 protein [Spirochaetota bacterium]MCX8096384.1 glycosyltransferase family 4 protein [Spirochaetota bacterium]MDW8112960.1 glycosyltransferase family 4 protein [Spirochaetia bacterium]